ncbi:MAG: nucleotidyltransferase family protein [Luminiphilus sp.]|nr:nucleotidyltransferase family protein [Luminiphilus sp.]
MKAMILAAGLGRRMLPLTQNTPKPLLEVAGKPLLEHHILNLSTAGITELVINAAYLADQIIAFCGDGSRWGVKIRVSVESEPLETAGGIIKALPLLGDTPFLVVNSDIWCPFPFDRLIECAPLEGGAHLILVPNPPHHADGDFSLEQGCVRVKSQIAFTYSGIGIYHPQFFQGFSSAKRPVKQPLKPLLDAAITAGKVTGELHTGTWIDVGTPQRLQALNEARQTAAPLNGR